MTQARLKPSRRTSRAMRPAPASVSRHRARSASGSRGLAGRSVLLAGALAGLLASGRARAAQPFIWDQDGDGIDDRIASVHLLGWSASFEMGDTTLRQRIAVLQGGPELLFGVYVRWEHDPSPSELAGLASLGMPVLARIEAIPASHSIGTFAQVAAASQLPGVQRVEAAPLLYPG